MIFVKCFKFHCMQHNLSVPTTEYLKKFMLFGIQHNRSEHSSTMQFSSTMILYIITKKNHYKLKKNPLKILKQSALITKMHSNPELILPNCLAVCYVGVIKYKPPPVVLQVPQHQYIPQIFK